MLTTALSGCDWTPDPEVTHRPGLQDKQALFGDAALIPTREGEQARRELAQAGEIAAAMKTFADLQPLRVNVEHHAVVTVLVAGRPGASTPPDLEARIRPVVASVLGPGTSYRLTLALGPQRQAPSPTQDPRLFPLMLAVVGLGISLGIVVERSVARHRQERGPFPTR